MSLGRLVLREILHRKLNFCLGVFSVLVAAGCLVATLAVLREHDLLTARLLTAQEAATKKQMDEFEDEIRKITVRMGFNILILPKDQNLLDFYASDYAAKCMPETYATLLARTRMVTLNHILPSLQQKIEWPEMKRTVLLIGIRGEVYMQSPNQKPMVQPIAAGQVILGHELHRQLALKKGDKVKLLGRDFTVAECRPEKGSKDDITLWIPLDEAQQLLGKQGLVNAILALECTSPDCGPVAALGQVRAEVAKLLPDTQVIEYQTQALARAEARDRAARDARETIERVKESRLALAREKETVAAVVVPLVLVACAAWIGYLAFSNARERRGETAILRALGLRLGQVLVLFVGRAALSGMLGAGLGYGAGLLFAVLWNRAPSMTEAARGLLAPAWLAGALAAAAALAVISSWLPALWAARQDPADILREG